jgi:hypothetical protein
MRRFALAAIASFAFVASATAQTPDIDGLLGALPGVVAHYDSKSELGGVVALENLTLARKNADGTADEANKVFIKRAEATALDGDAILSVFDAARYGAEPDQTFRTLVGRLDLTEVSFIANGMTVVSLAGWTVEAVEMKQFWFKPGGPDFMAQFGSDKERGAKVIGNLLDSTRIGPSRVTGVHMEIDSGAMAAAMVPGAPAQATGLAVYDYAEITSEGFDRGRWGKMTFAGIIGTAPMPPMGAMQLSVADGSWDGFDVTKLLPFLMRAEWPPTEPEGLLSYGAACFRNYDIKLPGIGTLNFPEACTDPIAFVWLIPQHVNFAMTGTFTPAPAGEFIAPPFVARHFTGPMAMTLAIEATYDPDSGTGALNHYKLGLQGFGSVDFAVTGGGLGLAGLAMLPQTYAQTLTFDGARLEVVDEGGMEKILQMTADAANERAGGQGEPVTPEALKAQAMMGLDMASGMLGGSPEGAAVIQAVKDFLTSGGTLVVEAKPPTPLNSAALTGLAGKPPAEMITTLGLTAQHN